MEGRVDGGGGGASEVEVEVELKHGLRRTDEWDKILSHSSVRHHGCSMVA